MLFFKKNKPKIQKKLKTKKSKYGVKWTRGYSTKQE
jgi:hypothetical protein